MRNFDQNEKAQIAARLAGGVSHDVNNRVGAIAGFATLIRMKSADANIKKSAEEILNVCRSMGEMSKTLLNIIRNDKHPVETIVNAHEAVGITADLLYNGLSMRTKFKCELNAKRYFILADTVQLQCAILNAGLKSAESAQRGETVAITTENITEGDHEYVKITVSGGGLAETMSFPIHEKL